MLVLGAASIGCGLSDSLTTLLIFRALQAAGGAAGLLAAFDLMDAGGHDASLGRRLWIAAAVFGSAAGPAIGGVLTEALDWRAIFFAQAPVALAASVCCWQLRIPAPHARASEPLKWAPAVGFALISAALTAVLFLLVLELVAGWSVDPLAAAAAVSVLPISALAAARIPGNAAARAICGCLLVAAGAGALAYLPDADLKWTIAPQILAGVGMGLAFPALAGGLLPERTSVDAARLLVARHVGIVAALLVIAPVVSGKLNSITESARYQGVAVVLDAKLDPRQKIDLAPTLLGDVESEDPRGGLQRAIKSQEGKFEGDARTEFHRLTDRLDDVIVASVARAFKPAFLITGALALLAALVLLAGVRLRLAAAAAVAAIAALSAAAFGAAIVIDNREQAPPVKIASPCLDRKLPDSGGLFGVLQDSALILLDKAACGYGSSREELVMALADDAEHERFKQKYGEDPRSAKGILQGLFG